MPRCRRSPLAFLEMYAVEAEWIRIVVLCNILEGRCTPVLEEAEPLHQLLICS